MKLFEREIKVSVIDVDGNFEINATLSDTTHDMQLTLLVEPKTSEIKKISAQMNRVPYDVCFEALKGIDELVGLRIKPGINRQVNGLIGGTKGCVHIVELVQECFRAAFQGNIRRVVNTLTGKERTRKLEEMLKDSCLKYTDKYSSAQLIID